MIDGRIIIFLFFIFFVTSIPALADINAFVYHRFGDQRYPSTNISLEQFESHLKEIEQKGYRVVTLSEALKLLDAGQSGAIAEDYAVITVDDGYRTFLTGAMPLLKRYGMVATVFVNTASVGISDEFLTWTELKQLRAEGVEIGNHSHGHMHMAQPREGEALSDWDARITSDLEMSNSIFLSKFGEIPRVIAYPYGEYSEALQQIVRRVGFTAAVAQQSGVISRYSDLFALPRFPMGGPYTSLESFNSKLTMKALPVKHPPMNPIFKKNPPQLLVEIDAKDGEGVDMGRANCFINGSSDCSFNKLEGDTYLIESTVELKQSRNKYTVTAPGVKGGWYWFSQLYIPATAN